MSRSAIRHRFAVAAMLGAALVAHAGAAAAQSTVAPQGGFTENNRFTVRNLRLNGQGASITLPGGGRVQGQLEYIHSCPICGGAINQIIVGLATDQRAQACIYSGGAVSGGWRSANFDLNVPSTPGTYEVRVRYAQAWDCNTGLNWWRMNRPNGPGPESTIGVIVVPAPQPVTPPPTGSTARSSQAIHDEIDGRLAWIEQEATKLQQGGAIAQPAELGWQIEAQAELIRKLTDELVAAAKREAPAPLPSPPVYTPPPPPPPAWSVPPVAIRAMPPADFNALVQRLENQSFERYRNDLLRDQIRAGSKFSIQQALTVVELFDFAQAKLQAAGDLCGAMAEPGGLPQLIAAMPYESQRQQLRRMTNGQCDPR